MSEAVCGKLRALVVDDEPLAARRLARALSHEPDVEVVATREDGKSALAALNEHACDVVFLDIRMPGLDGLDVARALKGPGSPQVVFVTAFSKFAPEAFGIDAVDYLLKPVETPRLRDTLERVRRRVEATRATAELAELRLALRGRGAGRAKTEEPEHEIWAPTAAGTVRLFLDQIDWISSEDDYVRLHVGARTYLMRATLQDLLAKAANRRFVRVHRSAAINLDRVRSFSRLPYGALSVTLTSGNQVRVSRRHAPSLRQHIRDIGRITVI